MNTIPQRAAGPIVRILYKNGKPASTETLPAPGDVNFALKVGKRGPKPGALVKDKSKCGKAAKKFASNPW